MSVNEYLDNIIKNIPDKPGCYQYYDSNNTIIYIGKAKNLKKRVSSYFTNSKQHNNKTRVLVSKIRDIKYIVVDTEEDTYLLENNLIKQHKPRYNIMLKDDKTYASIVIKNEYFPRVYQTRNLVKDGSLYFGPYTSGKSIKAILEVIHKLYPIRTCKLPLTPDTIRNGNYKICLEYHIKRCKGPCEGFQELEDYNENIENIKEILKGDIQIISRKLFDQMQQLAADLKFEEAQQIKDKYDLIETFKTRSTVVSQIMYNIDVFAYEEENSSAYINYLSVHNGAIIQAYTFEYKKKLDEEKEEILSQGIFEMRTRFGSQSKEIVVPFLPNDKLQNIEYTIPQRGDKRKLLDLSIQNVKQYKFDKLKRAESLNPEQRKTRILKEIQKDLHLKELPVHIECFDNSNIQGTNPVAACVVFKMGKPSKKDYRHFNVKTVEGPDDFESMREIVYRRYHRLMEENAPLPQLIVIDGGKGQLNAACESLKELGVYGKVAIISIAKRLEELYFPEDNIPLYLEKTSETLRVIQHLRDEAHRFGITFHRNQRSRSQTKSELDNIKGIGKTAKEALLKKFKSTKRVKESSLEELEEVVGKHKANLIKEYFDINN